MVITLITIVSWIIAGFVSYNLYKKLYTNSVDKRSKEDISYVIFYILFISTTLSAFVILIAKLADNWNLMAMVTSFCLTCAGPIVIGILAKKMVQKKIEKNIVNA